MTIGRRGALGALASAPVALSAVPADQDPHVEWQRQLAVLFEQALQLDEAGEDSDALVAKAIVLEDLIAQTPARTLLGALLQLRMAHLWQVPVDADGSPDEFALPNAIATLERLVGRA